MHLALVVALLALVPTLALAAEPGRQTTAPETKQGPKALWQTFPLGERNIGPLLRTPAPAKRATIGVAVPPVSPDPGSESSAPVLRLMVGVLVLLAIAGMIVAGGPIRRARSRRRARQRVRTAAEAYLLVVPTVQGPAVVEREGRLPKLGELVYDAAADVRHPLVVELVGPSPIPGDSRPCAFLQQI